MVKILFIRLLMPVMLGAVVLGLQSCLPLAAGAAAGYVAHDQGYRVQAPVTQQ